MSAAPLPDLDTLDAAGLKALIVSQQEQLLSHVTEIEHLRLLLARLQRLQFGQKSEKVQRQIEQLELRLDDLETSEAESQQRAEETLPPAAAAVLAWNRKPARRSYPSICRERLKRIRPRAQLVRTAVVRCANWAKMWPRCWSMSRLALK